MSTHETDLAWAAGFIDGEGCRSSHRDRRWNTKNIRLTVAQKRIDCLERLSGVLKIGKIYPSRTNGTWILQVAIIDDVLRVAEDLWPYMSTPKKEQLVKVLYEVKEHKDNTNRKVNS